ncbi:MAG TPA: hypothetical protein DCG19_03555 [Cryomorphaceae bacterium]|nr:hypothetical protein [Owenweeksia sp.]MBF97474.1 hypothetical protein [Owenweeksia sp.]HAD96455.1 hypothetical protein [Cryomorphaceae bacterium]HBF21783.1 hypothetical protein [Cryomorphaceae bacterium]HCQ15662.1 hypothetical protein [Cryomorphaceae bacterium]|tara:strand:+ start:553 stop:1002 length:450 start_codon:yes stop_codon:yes gene_type:complete
MKLIRLFFFAGALTILNSCSTCGNEGEPTENRGLIIRSVFIPQCASRLRALPDELVINNDSTLAYYFSMDPGCAWEVDLENETLLRYPSQGQCDVKLVREVKKDGEGGYIYQKTIDECGDCNLGVYDEGWVLVEIKGDAAQFKFRTIRN